MPGCDSRICFAQYYEMNKKNQFNRIIRKIPQTTLLLLLSLAFFGCAPESSDHNSAADHRKPVATLGLPDCAECSADALSVAQNLANRGLNCNFGPVSSRRAFRCQGRIGDYPRPIDIFIPPSLNLAQRFALAYHLHGWWKTASDNPFLGANGDYGAFLADSGKNALLIIPESQGKNATYAASLDTAARMTTFFTQTEDALNAAGLPVRMSTPRLLSGHSGAYVQLGRMGDWAAAGTVAQLQALQGFALLDSAYGYRAGLVQFIDVMCANASATFMLTYNPNDGSAGKKSTNLRILSEISGARACAHAQIIHQPDSKTVHVAFPREHLSAFIREALAQL